MKKTAFLTTVVLALATLVATAQGQPVTPPAGPAPSVDAVDTGAPVDSELRIDSDDTVVPSHPPLHMVPPMPMPTPREAPEASTIKEISSITYDVRTTKEYVSEPQRLEATSGVAGSATGYAGADGGTGDGDTSGLASFSTMSLVNAQISPWRMNVKLLMKFGADYFVCSGTMVDAETVLTAGHCVYDYGGAGWADNIWVYPGWDGGTWDPDDEFYGEATATNFISNTGWTVSGNLDWDVGAIRVTRAAGALTGWFGYAWGGDCNFRLGQSWNNASYPAESCGGGLHTGDDMYYWAGTFDSCYGSNRLQINTTGGCFDALWGGQSGSGAYYIDGTSRYVHAVASTSNRSTWGRYARVYTTFATGTGGLQDFITGSRGSSFDLQALDMATASSTTVQAGSSFTGVNHLASNSTNGSDSDTYLFRVYLSTNDNISSADTLLSTQTYSRSFSGMLNVRVNMAGFTIPVSTTPGTYWVGVEYDPATDGVSANNDTDNWDALQIRVTAPPSYTLSVKKTGTGSGTVTSSPAGINCGTDCSESYITGTAVGLSATPAAGSTFGGWSGDADCSDGKVTMSANRGCIATFNLVQSYTLSVKKDGTGSGTVTSVPKGINCGTDCSQDYLEGTAVGLTATPAAGSTFGGWSGSRDCSDGKVTMNVDQTCVATFTSSIVYKTLTVRKIGTGSGTVTSSPAGIDCGSDCTQNYLQGTAVTLTATPAAGSIFGGWSGDADCSDGKVTMSVNLVCSVTFNVPGDPDAWLAPPSQTVGKDNAFELDVRADSDSGLVGTYTFGMTFNPALVQVDTTQCNQGVCPGSEALAANIVNTNNAAGTIDLSGFDVAGTGPGVDLQLLVIHFVAQSTPALTHVGLTVTTLTDELGGSLGTVGEGAEVEITDVLCGDADGSGSVNIVDALAIARYVAGLPPPPPVNPAAADVNGDGVNIVDALMIARYTAGLPVAGTCLAP